MIDEKLLVAALVLTYVAAGYAIAKLYWNDEVKGRSEPYGWMAVGMVFLLWLPLIFAVVPAWMLWQTIARRARGGRS